VELKETERTEQVLHRITLAWELKSHSVASGDISESYRSGFSAFETKKKKKKKIKKKKKKKK
jgi:hypothetical protein